MADNDAFKQERVVLKQEILQLHDEMELVRVQVIMHCVYVSVFHIRLTSLQNSLSFLKIQLPGPKLVSQAHAPSTKKRVWQQCACRVVPQWNLIVYSLGHAHSRVSMED